MTQYTVAAYNVRWMNSMFAGNAVKPTEVERAEAIAAVIQRVDPARAGPQ